MLKSILEKIYTRLTEPALLKAKETHKKKDRKVYDTYLSKVGEGKKTKRSYPLFCQGLKRNKQEYDFTVAEIRQKWAWLKRLI